MKAQSTLIRFLVFEVIVALHVPLGMNGQTPQQTFQQYVADLQGSPNDTALRGKIIALAQTMNPPPAIPEEAREHYVMAATFMESAKDATGFGRAVEQYKAALLVAPWWADAYGKLAIAQKAAAQFDDAIASLNLYLLTQPADARDAQDEIYKLKALKQAAADEAQRRADEERARANSPEAIAARKQTEYDAWLKSLDGVRYVRETPLGYTSTIDIHGHYVEYGSINHSCTRCGGQPVGVWQSANLRFQIEGRQFVEHYPGGVTCTSTIGDDEITGSCSNGATAVYQRIR